jgi:TRAP-type C4-dicarboxylate transport system substrate-binding protein
VSLARANTAGVVMAGGKALGIPIGRRAFVASTAASLAAPAFVRASLGDGPRFRFKLHHAHSSVSCAHVNFLVPWARAVEAQAGGRIRIDIFPSMQLGGQPVELFDQARDGVADIVWTRPSDTPGRFPRIEMFELPFVPPRRALVGSKAIADFSPDNLKDEFREVRPICFSCADRGIVHTSRPVQTADDMKGLRLDVGTRFAGEAVQAMGARALLMPSAQLPLAITRHIVDGCVIPWNMVPALKLHDLLKAHADFADYSLSTTTFALVMNKAAYEGLPADLKKVIDDNSGQVAAGMAGTMWDLQAGSVVDMVQRRGDPIVVLAPDAVAPWRKVTQPVIDAWLKQMKARKIDGEKLLASARSLFDKYASEPEPQPPRPPQSAQQPVEAKAETKPAAKAGGASDAPQSPAPATQVSAATPAPSAPQPHWWQFWKSAPTPPAGTASAAPTAPPASTPTTHWWQFWKSASAPTSAPASAAPSVTAATPAPPAAAAPAAPPAAAMAPPTAVPPPAPPAAAAIVQPPPATPALPASPPPLKTLDIPL